MSLIEEKPLLAFALAFVIFFCVGALQNYAGERRKATLLYIEAAHLTPYKVRSSFDIRYECKGATLYSWNVDSNTLTPSSQTKLARIGRRVPVSQPPIGLSVLAPFFGGVSGAWTVKDVLELEAGDSVVPAVKRLGALVLGGVTGFSVGTWVSSHSIDCDDPGILDHLDSLKSWPSLEQQSLASSLLAVVDSAPGRLFQLNIATRSRVEGAIDVVAAAADPKSQDFAAVENLSAAALAFYSQQPFFYRLPYLSITPLDKIKLGAMALFVSLLGAALYHLMRKARARMSRHRARTDA